MTKDFWKQIKKPILALSPMEGWTDSAMRQIVKSINSEVVTFTEFTSVEGLYHNPKKIKERLFFEQNEKPVIAQIYGKNLENFKNAVKICEDLGFTGIDINMGCPAKKVVKSEQGIALRKNHDLAFRMIEIVAKSTTLPVSVKTRLGWNDASDLIEFSKGAENAGADLLSIHARTYQVPYGCEPEYEPLYELKKHIKIPLIGNGGITEYSQIGERLKNLDGIMVGQGAMGNPWVFSKNTPATFKDKIPTIKLHVDLLIKIKGERVGLLHSRKHLLSYIKGIEGASDTRKKLATAKSKEEIFTILDSLA